MTSAGLLLSLSLAGLASPRSIPWTQLSLRNMLPVRQVLPRPSVTPHGLTGSYVTVNRPPPAKLPPRAPAPSALQVANAVIAFTPAAPLVAAERPLQIVGSAIADAVLGSAEFSPSLFSGIRGR